MFESQTLFLLVVFNSPTGDQQLGSPYNVVKQSEKLNKIN